MHDKGTKGRLLSPPAGNNMKTPAANVTKDIRLRLFA